MPEARSQRFNLLETHASTRPEKLAVIGSARSLTYRPVLTVGSLRSVGHVLRLGPLGTAVEGDQNDVDLAVEGLAATVVN